MRTLLIVLLALQERHSLILKDDQVLASFADAHGKDAIGTLRLDVAKRRPSLAPPARLKSVDVLILTGFADQEPRRRDGKSVFLAGLSDEQVAEIAKVESLTRFELWYGSVTDEQRKVLTGKLPRCRIEDNLNKL